MRISKSSYWHVAIWEEFAADGLLQLDPTFMTLDVVTSGLHGDLPNDVIFREGGAGIPR